jgi:hypothetical protein
MPPAERTMVIAAHANPAFVAADLQSLLTWHRQPVIMLTDS